MPAAESIITALNRNWAMVDAALEGLDDDTLARQPADQCNSIAWILWHMTRVADSFIHTRLRGVPQSWARDGWHQKFGMSDDPENRGVGWTAQQVAEWQPPPGEVQLGYYHAVIADTREYLESLTQADLEKQVVIPPVAEPRTVAAVVGQWTWDAISHGGQIAYLRGLYRGMGWHV